MNTRALQKRIRRIGKGPYAVLRFFSRTYRRAVMAAARLGGVQKNRVVFLAFDARAYSDNPRYISEMLHKMRPETEIIWNFRNPEKKKHLVPPYVRVEKWMSVRSLKDLATARVVVSNFCFIPFFRFKRPQQVYVQTWHGERGFKKVAYDKNESYYLLEQDCDLGVIGSDYGDMLFRSAFHYKGELLKKGCPRNDILIRRDPSEAKRIREALKVPEGVRLLLYAPTYRDDLSMGGKRHRAGIDLRRTLEAVERQYGGQWMCLYRAHYLSAGIDVEAMEGKIVNAIDHEEMAELLLISDALLTDYSSCAGDFALLGRPVFLFQDDLEDYKTRNRDMYFNMEDSPYLVSRTQEELEALIQKTSLADAEKNCRDILEFYGTFETGRATQAVCEYVISKLNAD